HPDKVNFYPQFNMTNNNYIYKYYIVIIRNTLCVLLVLFINSLPAQNLTEIQLANEYLLKGEKKKALEIYRDLSKTEANVPIIHNNYLNLLLDDGLYDEAQSYLRKNLRKEPENIIFKLDLGITFVRSGDLSKS